MARLRHSVSGGPSRRFVGDSTLGRRISVDEAQLVAVEEFHREFVQVAVELEKFREFPKKEARERACVGHPRAG